MSLFWYCLCSEFLRWNICLWRFLRVLRGGIGWGLGWCSLGEETASAWADSQRHHFKKNCDRKAFQMIISMTLFFFFLMRTLERSGTNIAGMKWVWWRWWIRWKWWRGVGPSWVITGCRRIKGDADFSPVVLLIMDTVCNSVKPCTSKWEIFASVLQSVLCYYNYSITAGPDKQSELRGTS